MTEINNPYRPPASPPQLAEQTVERKHRKWLVFVAALWVVGLFLILPALGVWRQAPSGTFLWMKLVTTGLSVGSGVVLATIPKRRWLWVTVPVIAFLAFVQYTAWVKFP